VQSLNIVSSARAGLVLKQLVQLLADGRLGCSAKWHLWTQAMNFTAH
jgi:hypothetical protein